MYELRSPFHLFDVPRFSGQIRVICSDPAANIWIVYQATPAPSGKLIWAHCAEHTHTAIAAVRGFLAAQRTLHHQTCRSDATHSCIAPYTAAQFQQYVANHTLRGASPDMTPRQLDLYAESAAESILCTLSQPLRASYQQLIDLGLEEPPLSSAHKERQLEVQRLIGEVSRGGSLLPAELIRLKQNGSDDPCYPTVICDWMLANKPSLITTVATFSEAVAELINARFAKLAISHNGQLVNECMGFAPGTSIEHITTVLSSKTNTYKPSNDSAFSAHLHSHALDSFNPATMSLSN